MLSQIHEVGKRSGGRVQKQELKLGKSVSSASNKGRAFQVVMYNSTGVVPNSCIIAHDGKSVLRSCCCALELASHLGVFYHELGSMQLLAGCIYCSGSS